MRELYRARKAAVERAIDSELSAWGRRQESDAGMHVVFRFTDRVDDVALVALLSDAGVEATALSRYLLRQTQENYAGLLLGFSGYTPAALTKGVRRIAEVLQRIL